MIRALVFLWLVIEAAVVVALGRAFGWLDTLVLALLVSAGGFVLLRGEGLVLATRMANFIRHAQRTGEVPPLPLADSIPRLLAGVLLVLPGFAKDALALLLLLPPVRRRIAARLLAWIAERHHIVIQRHGMRDGGPIDIHGEVLPEDGEPPPPDFRERPRLPPPDA